MKMPGLGVFLRQGETTMRAWALAVLVALLACVALAANQAPANGSVPKYDKATEIKLNGSVVDVRDYNCPISGTMGAHLTLKVQDGSTIELHLAATKYVKSYEMVFNKGDEIEKPVWYRRTDRPANQEKVAGFSGAFICKVTMQA